MQELIERLEDEHPKVRADAAADLIDRCRVDAEARGRYAMRFLTLLNDDSPAVRGQAVVGAILCDDELVNVDRVAKLLEDPSPGVRLQAVHTLGPLGLPELEERFAVRLEDPDRLVRVSAAAALATSRDPRAVPVLLAALDSRHTREEALHALRGLVSVGDRAAIEAGARRILGRILSSRYERIAAAGVLAALGLEDGKRQLLVRMEKRGADRPVAMEIAGELRLAEAASILGRVAGDKADPLRGTALRALASLGSPEALRLCERVLLDEAEDADTRSDAAEGLLLHGGEEAEAALEKARGAVQDDRVRRVVEACLDLFGKPPEEIRLYLPLSGDEVIG